MLTRHDKDWTDSEPGGGQGDTGGIIRSSVIPATLADRKRLGKRRLNE